MNPTPGSCVGHVLGRPRGSRRSCILVLGYGIGLLAPRAADRGSRSPERSIPGSPRLYCIGHARFPFPLRRLERPRAEADPAVRRRGQRSRAEIKALTDAGDPRPLRRAPRRDPRSGRPRGAVRRRAPPPRPRAPPRARQGPPRSATTRRIQAALDDILPGRLRDGPRGDAADARDAPLRRAAHRRRRAPPGQDRRDEDRRGQDLRRRPSPRPSTRSPAAASTSSPSTTTSPGATRSGWARSSTSSA